MDHESAHEPAKTLILLHGSRQTGDLLLGRLQKLQKRLWRDANVELIAPTASFPCEEDPNLRQWWRWTGPGSNHYEGFADETVPQLQKLWKSLPAPIGFIGFSQGGRLAHLAAVLHQRKPSQYFPGLQCLIFVSGYDAPLPDGLEDWCPASQSSSSTLPTLISTPSLHVWGLEDGLITPQQSLALQKQYAPDSTQTFIHDGGHYVPMQAAAVRSMVDFVQATLKHASDGNYLNKSIKSFKSNNSNNDSHENDGHSMDEETKQLQIEEVQALEAIFPDKLQLPSDFYLEPDNEFNGSNQNVRFPIRYTLRIDSTEQGLWPKHPLYLHVTYPFDYPQARPKIDIKGDDNNVFEFSSAARNALSHAIHKIMDESESMPCVYACYVAAQEFFETGGMEMAAGDVADNPSATPLPDLETNEMRHNDQGVDGDIHPTHLPRAASPARIQQCQQEGLELSALVLSRLGASNKAAATSGLPNDVSGGGVWKFTIGLIGKPSAGKSTLFNAATAFARQRNAAANRANHASHASQDPTEHWLGGASMAPHPFTTIDPNVGVSVVPAPLGLCPEDDVDAADFVIGSTHGRDHEGRRLLPVVVKDVAGLVPGAYQGRGRGNQFLNDLTDADVLVHVVDASGSADKEGNALGVEGDGTLPESASHPLIDMQWILVELIEWVHTNLLYKWESILKKGRPKLAGMLSGYGYNRDSISAILNTVEDYMKKYEKRDRPMEDLSDWDDGDLHRLVTAFVGSRCKKDEFLVKQFERSSGANFVDLLVCDYL